MVYAFGQMRHEADFLSFLSLQIRFSEVFQVFLSSLSLDVRFGQVFLISLNLSVKWLMGFGKSATKQPLA